MTEEQLLALHGSDIGALAAALRGEVTEALEGAGKVNAKRLGQWAEQLAEVAVESGKKFALGEITEQQFDYVMDVQYMSAKNVLLYVENLPLVAAQLAVNAAFKVVGHAIRNATGLNLMPELVKA